MDLQTATITVQIAAAICAVALARRRPEHIPAAVALAVLAIVPLIRAPMNAALLPPREAPWEGLQRLLVYLDGAAELLTGAIVPGLAVAAFVDKPKRPLCAVALVWALASVALAVLYPSPIVRGASLQRLYIAADLFGIFVSIVTIARWAGLRRSPNSAHGIAIGLVVLDFAILVMPYSPWRGLVYAGRFDGVHVVILVTFAAAAAFQGVLVWFSRAR
jgi:hypothetical protein